MAVGRNRVVCVWMTLHVACLLYITCPSEAKSGQHSERDRPKSREGFVRLSRRNNDLDTLLSTHTERLPHEPRHGSVNHWNDDLQAVRGLGNDASRWRSDAKRSELLGRNPVDLAILSNDASRWRSDTKRTELPGRNLVDLAILSNDASLRNVESKASRFSVDELSLSNDAPRTKRALGVSRGKRLDSFSESSDVSQTHGPVRASQTHGPVRASQTNGPVRASQTNGPVRASQTHGPVRVSQTNGPVRASQTNGPVRAAKTLEVELARVSNDAWKRHSNATAPETSHQVSVDSTRATKRSGRSVNGAGVNRAGVNGAGVSLSGVLSPSPGVYTRPSVDTLPSLYWIHGTDPKPLGLGTPVFPDKTLFDSDGTSVDSALTRVDSDQTPTDSDRRNVDASAGKTTSNAIGFQNDVTARTTMPPLRTLRTVSLPASLSHAFIHKRVSVQGVSAQALVSQYRTLAAMTTTTADLTPEGRGSVSVLPGSAGRRSRDNALSVSRTGRSYPYPDTGPRPTVLAPQSQRDRLILNALATMTAQGQPVGQGQSVVQGQYVGHGHLPSSQKPQDGDVNVVEQRNEGGPCYDDYPTPSPSAVSVSVHPIPPRKASSSARSPPASSAQPHPLYTGVPTAAPHPRAPSPTAAPVRRQPQPPGGSTPYPVPTLFAALSTQPGAGLGALLDKMTTVPGHLTGVGGGGVNQAETVCLQYLRVQHDVSCGSRRVRREVATTQHLTLLLQHYGGSASSPFMAPTVQEADSTFRNLLPLNIPNNPTPLLHKAHKIRRLLENHYTAKHNSTSATSQPRSEKSNGGGNSAQPKGLNRDYRAEHTAGEETLLPGPGDWTLPRDVLDQLVPASHVTFNHTAQRTRRGLDDARVERDAGYCLVAGRQGLGSHVHLCTQCQHTRSLGDDVFPSVIQEVVCNPDDAPCLDIASHGPQGACRESSIPVSVLRRNHGRCMIVTLTSGQSLEFDDWRLAQLMVSTGCQCVLDRRSALAASL